jgi:TPR repeat protein
VEELPPFLLHPPSLEPVLMPSPPPRPARKLHVSLGIAIVCIATSLAGYAFLLEPSSETTSGSQMASAVSTATRAQASQPRRPSQAQPDARWDGDWPQWSTSPASDALAKAEPLPEPSAALPTSTSLQPPATRPQPADKDNAATRMRRPVPALAPGEIDALLEQGEKFIAAGDVVTARLLFERAAKADNATAALALAAAYDPVVLSRLGVMGIDTDVDKARVWYQKAQSLGATQADDRLRALAER